MSAVRVIKFLVIFEQGGSQFHFALGPTYSIVNAAYIHHVSLFSASSFSLSSSLKVHPLSSFLKARAYLWPAILSWFSCREPLGSLCSMLWPSWASLQTLSSQPIPPSTLDCENVRLEPLLHFFFFNLALQNTGKAGYLVLHYFLSGKSTWCGNHLCQQITLHFHLMEVLSLDPQEALWFVNI